MKVSTSRDSSASSGERYSGNMLLSFYSQTGTQGVSARPTWSNLGSWYYNLAHPRQQDSPQIHAKVVEITAGAKSDWERIQCLTAYAQSRIRYVAIEIGIGGYQPILRRTFSDRDTATARTRRGCWPPCSEM